MPENTSETGTAESWLLREAGTVRNRLVAAAVWAFCAGLLVVLQARLLADACHMVVIGHAPAAEIMLPATVVAVAALIRGLLMLLSEKQAAAAAAQLKSSLRDHLYRRLQQLAPTGRLGEDTAALQENCSAAVEALEPYLTRFLPQLALAALLPAAVLLFVFPSEWRSGLVLLFSAPFIPLLMVLIGRGSEKLHRHQWSHLARLSARLLDLIQGLPDLKIFGAVRHEAATIRQFSDQYRQTAMTVLRVAFLSALTLEFFASVGTAVVAVVVGFRLLDGTLTLADGLFVLLLAPEFYLPLRNLGLSYHARMQGIAAAERIAPLMSMPLPQQYQGGLPAPSTAPSVVLEGVTFRYSSGRGGLEGISLELPAGSLTAVVGESGSGKTTLARLITGLAQPESGRITVNGIDLQAISASSWRAGLVWIPQRPFFFKGTIRENMLLGCPTATDDEIRAALQSAAADFIMQKDSGLDTMLGGGGSGLSGGELRRLALARAMLRRPVLAVLDEPTAGLDSATERLVVNGIEKLAQSATVLLISHREDTVAMAGRIAFLADGRLDRVACGGTP